MRQLNILVLLAFTSLACKGGEEKSARSPQAATQPPATPAPQDPQPATPAGCAGSGASTAPAQGGILVFDLEPKTVDPCTVAVVVVGAQAAPQLRVLPDGTYEVSGAP